MRRKIKIEKPDIFAVVWSLDEKVMVSKSERDFVSIEYKEGEENQSLYFNNYQIERLISALKWSIKK